MQSYGIEAVIRIVLHMLFIYISFWSLQSIKLDQFFKAYQSTQIRVLILFFSIVIGYTVSSFFLEFLSLCQNLFSGLFF